MGGTCRPLLTSSSSLSAMRAAAKMVICKREQDSRTQQGKKQCPHNESKTCRHSHCSSENWQPDSSTDHWPGLRWKCWAVAIGGCKMAVFDALPLTSHNRTRFSLIYHWIYQTRNMMKHVTDLRKKNDIGVEQKRCYTICWVHQPQPLKKRYGEHVHQPRCSLCETYILEFH